MKPAKIYWPITHCHNYLFHLSSLWNLLTIFHYVNTFQMIQCIGLRQISCNLRQSRKHTILLRLVLSGQYVYWEVFGICEESLKVLFFSPSLSSINLHLLSYSFTYMHTNLWDNHHREIHNLKAKSFLQRDSSWSFPLSTSSSTSKKGKVILELGSKHTLEARVMISTFRCKAVIPSEKTDLKIMHWARSAKLGIWANSCKNL